MVFTFSFLIKVMAQGMVYTDSSGGHCFGAHEITPTETVSPSTSEQVHVLNWAPGEAVG